ncbi:universal stress protein [Leptolyngbya sp. AN03gr2]|uniref:universal stress protein n=1 Tax=unclassified Leptolyngbya TaxID=2650499 RepID=UPI003D3229C8
MLKKILVALDDSTVSAIVFDYALTLARSLNTELMIVHVVEPDEARHPLTELLSPTEWEIRLQSYVEQAKALDVPAEFMQSYGNPGHIICDWAWSCRADLIVLGRQGQSEVSGWIVGSVSRYVNQHSPCSVLMVAPPQQRDSNNAHDRHVVEV